MSHLCLPSAVLLAYCALTLPHGLSCDVSVLSLLLSCDVSVLSLLFIVFFGFVMGILFFQLDRTNRAVGGRVGAMFSTLLNQAMGTMMTVILTCTLLCVLYVFVCGMMYASVRVVRFWVWGAGVLWSTVFIYALSH